MHELHRRMHTWPLLLVALVHQIELATRGIGPVVLVGLVAAIAAWRWPRALVALGLVVVLELLLANVHAANHHWLMVYLVWAWCISGRDDLAPERFATQVRVLASALMGLAALQKFLEPSSIDGSYVALMIAKGSLGGWMLELLPGAGDAMAANAKAIVELRRLPPGPSTVLRQPIAELELVAKVAVWSTIVIEWGMALALAAYPRARWTHALVVAFVVAVASTRPEFLFLALVTAMVAVLAPHERWRTAEVSLAVVLMIAALVRMALVL